MGKANDERIQRTAEQRGKECGTIAAKLIEAAWSEIMESMAKSGKAMGRATISFKFIGDMSRPVIKPEISIPCSVKIGFDSVEGSDPDQIPLPFVVESAHG